MSALPEEAAKVRLPQRRRRRRGCLCPGRPLTGVRTLGDVIGAYRWLKANEPVRGAWFAWKAHRALPMGTSEHPHGDVD